MTKPRLLLADDHAILLDGLKVLLTPDFDIVATATDGRAALEAAETCRPDIILLDISMPGLNGLEAARRLKQSNPRAKLVMLTMHGDLSYVRESFEAGVSGYVLKQCMAAELVTALKAVAQGWSFVSPPVRERLGTILPDFSRSRKRNAGGLTPRQREVLQLLAEGRTRKEISQSLGVSVKTVEFHRQNICEKLGLRTNAELTAYAIRNGIAMA